MFSLKDLIFVDLYLGPNYAEIKGLQGAATSLCDLPADYLDDARSLKNLCDSVYDGNRSEFSLFYDGRFYRITVINNVFEGMSYVIRQTPSRILDFNLLPLSSDLRRSVDLPSTTGLCLIAGAMGCGKTTTAASILRHRIIRTGAIGVSIEDPIETLLHGRHGDGRCIQLEVGQHETYATATKKAWRTGAGCLLLGEIRDAETAQEVLKASLSMFVVSTIHAASVLDAVERYVMFCEEVNPNARQNIANTLYILAHQQMSFIYRNNNIASRNVEITGYNLVHCTQRAAIKAKINNGAYAALIDEFNGINYTLR